MNLSDNLKRIRKENNLSQEQLAEKLNVSRQSVSKWESGIAYPEMDKVLQLCKMFNLNIDELLNQNVKEVDNSKQSKNNINKIIDSFFDYITKTINLFSSMKFKEKIKCLFEQVIIIFVLCTIISLLGCFFSNIFYNLLSVLPEKAYYVTYHIFEALYLIVTATLAIIIVLHIFKTRYLDYFVYVKEEPIQDNKEVKENNEEKENKSETISNNKKERVIIRDPKHSEYKFITNTLKVILFFIKMFVAFIGLCFSLLFVSLVVGLAVSFAFIKTGLLFIGALLCILAALTITFVILAMIYNFITSRKNLSLKLPVLFIIALILGGVGAGMVMIDATNFNIVDIKHNEALIKDEYTFDMKKGLVIYNYNDDINYIESSNKDIKIVYSHNKYYSLTIDKSSNNTNIYLYHGFDDNNEFNMIRQIMKDVNDKKIIDYYDYSIDIYTTKDNIEALKKNYEKYQNNKHVIEEQYKELYDTISDLEDSINEKDRELEEKIGIIDEKDSQIAELEERIEELENYEEE